jgi:hypothetical protein
MPDPAGVAGNEAFRILGRRIAVTPVTVSVVPQGHTATSDTNSSPSRGKPVVATYSIQE